MPVAAESAARLLSPAIAPDLCQPSRSADEPNRPREAGSFCQLDQQPKLQQRNGDEQDQKSEKHGRVSSTPNIDASVSDRKTMRLKDQRKCREQHRAHQSFARRSRDFTTKQKGNSFRSGLSPGQHGDRLMVIINSISIEIASCIARIGSINSTAIEIRRSGRWSIRIWLGPLRIIPRNWNSRS